MMTWCFFHRIPSTYYCKMSHQLCMPRMRKNALLGSNCNCCMFVLLSVFPSECLSRSLLCFHSIFLLELDYLILNKNITHFGAFIEFLSLRFLNVFFSVSVLSMFWASIIYDWPSSWTYDGNLLLLLSHTHQRSRCYQHWLLHDAMQRNILCNNNVRIEAALLITTNGHFHRNATLSMLTISWSLLKAEETSFLNWLKLVRLKSSNL